MDAFEDPKAGETLFKIGRTTGLTVGKLNATYGYLHSKYCGVWPEVSEDIMHDFGPEVVLDQPTVAKVNVTVSAFARGQAFCKRGDSGSVVFNGEGRMVGLLVAGTEAFEVGFFTPQRELLEDIKAMTGAKTIHLVGMRDL